MQKKIKTKEKEYSDLIIKTELARNNWMRITNQLMFYTSKDMDRETPKKIDVTNKNINITNLSDLFKKAREDIEDNVIDIKQIS